MYGFFDICTLTDFIEGDWTKPVLFLLDGKLLLGHRFWQPPFERI